MTKPTALRWKHWWHIGLARTAAINESGERARAAIFQPITHIVALSSQHPFTISHWFWPVAKYQVAEYLPCLKQHFAAILDNPRDHYWKIVDCARGLATIDPAFVNEALAARGKTLADFSA